MGQVPSVPKATGLLVLILNIFLPGTGSILAGLQANSSSCVFIGVIQFFLFGLLFGWIWSIWWGSGTGIRDRGGANRLALH